MNIKYETLLFFYIFIIQIIITIVKSSLNQSILLITRFKCLMQVFIKFLLIINRSWHFRRQYSLENVETIQK